MSRFVRASSYRHVYGQGAKKEAQYDNIKVSASAWDTNLVSVNGTYLSVNSQVSGGGAFLVCPLSHTGKLPDLYPLARAHSAPVLDTAWNPFHEDIVASAGEDCKVQLTKVDPDALEAAFAPENAEVNDLKPLPTNLGHSRKVGHVLWHPTADNVLASASYDIKLWDVGAGSAQIELAAHPDMVQSLAFDSRGTLLVTTCKDKKLRMFDVRAGADPVKSVESHGGIKASRVAWCGALDRIVTTGFSKLSDRQLFLWDAGNLEKPLKQLNVDASSAGTLMPFWSDNNLLYLAGKGDGNIRYYEYEADELHYLTEYKSSQPQRGMTFLPRRALNVAEHEIARAYKVTNNCIEPISFCVPRKSDSFQADIYPPAPAAKPALSAHDFFAGQTAEPTYVALDSGAATAAPARSTPVSTPARKSTDPPKSTPVTPSRQMSAASNAPSPVVPAAAPSPRAPSPEPVPSPRTPQSAEPTPRSPLTATSNGHDDSALQAEVADLKRQLVERDELVRNLELQCEKYRRNWQQAKELFGRE